MNITKLLKQTKKIEIDFGSEKGSIEYYPNVFTPEFEDAIRDVTGDDTSVSLLIGSQLVRLIAKWDLTREVPVMGENGEQQTHPDNGAPLFNIEPLPITIDGLRCVPIQIQAAILKAINKDVQPGNENEPTSEGSF